MNTGETSEQVVSLKVESGDNGHWIKLPISELVSLRMGKTILSKELTSEGIPVFSAGAENRLWGYVAHSNVIFDNHTVIISARGTIGSPKLPHYANYVSTQTTIAARPKGAIIPSFLQRFLCTINWDELTATTAIPMLTISNLSKLKVPVPPLNEQTRIVSKIDELFSRIDAGEKALNRSKALVERCRKSVLNAAVTGELTREWREQSGDKTESANMLLERILMSRRQAWEAAELAKLRAKGKEPKNDAWKMGYTEPAGPNLPDLPDLPEGWVWVTIKQIAQVSGGLTKSAKRGTRALKLPMLRVANVYAGRLSLGEIHETTLDRSELDRVLLKQDDLLVVEGNGSVDQIGRVAIWDGSIPECVHQNHLIKIRFDEFELGRYCLIWLLSSLGREFIQRVASSSSGLHTLSISKIEALPFPLAPMAEANEIVRIAEDDLAEIIAVGKSIAGEDKPLATLRQAILKAAFEGKLVSQDPSDEPATALLERIRSANTAPKSSELHKIEH